MKNAMMLKKAMAAMFVMAMLCGVGEAQAKVYLVSVGISDYPGIGNDLSLPVNDAKTITWLYSKNVELQYCQLLDSEATVAKIVAAMNKVYAKAGANDQVVFFFSGHGYDGGFVAYDGRLDYSKIQKAMAKSKCKNKMIFADACFAGSMRGQRKATTGGTRKKMNVMLFLSSRDNEVSMENPRMSNGYFTSYLQKALRGNADANRNRVITAKELFVFVSENVAKATNDMQHPVMWGNFSNNMPVMVW